MPTYYFKTYRRAAKGATTGILSAMKGIEADNIQAAEAQVSGHFASFDFIGSFAVLEGEDGKHLSYWLQDPRNA